jgi:Domain of unknown function (DUF4349)
MQTLTTTDHKPLKLGRTFVTLVLVPLAILLIAVISIPNLLRSRIAADEAARVGRGRQAASSLAEENKGPAPADVRSVIQSGSMQLTVGDPAAAMEEIAALIRRAGGFVESSELYRGGNEIPGAQIIVRVPATGFDATRAEIRRLGKRVNRETTNSSDVTAQYVDSEATLRNYRAEEAQYLGIMRSARNVKDTLDVAQRLSDVRGRIERTQAQLNLLSHKVEMASLEVSLRAEVGANSTVNWSPLHELRSAWTDSLQGFADYMNAMFVVLLRIPLVLAWAFTVCALAALAWRVLRWIWRHWFLPPAVSQAAL